MSVCFVILHYKKTEETARCIESILKMRGNGGMEILVVDNSMSDNSGQIIKERYCAYGNIHVIPSEKNAGFSRGNNIGYQYGLKHFQPDFMVVVNNDIEFLQEDFEEKLEDLYRQTGFAVLGPDVMHAVTGGHQSPIDLKLRTEEEAEATIRKNRIALKFFGILAPVLGLVLDGMYDNKGNGLSISYEERHQQVVLLGACLIFSRKFMDCCRKAFEPETEFFYEEYILACRCERMGMKMVYDPAIRVRHESGAAIRQSYGERRRRLKFILCNIMRGCQVYLDYIRGNKTD